MERRRLTYDQLIRIVRKQEAIIDDLRFKLQEVRGSYRPDHPYNLTRQEQRIAETLARRPEMVFSYEALFNVLDSDAVNAWPMIKVLVSRVRAKTARDGVVIETVRGMGYRMTRAGAEIYRKRADV